jgi:hypothetical protein
VFASLNVLLNRTIIIRISYRTDVLRVIVLLFRLYDRILCGKIESVMHHQMFNRVLSISIPACLHELSDKLPDMPGLAELHILPARIIYVHRIMHCFMSYVPHTLLCKRFILLLHNCVPQSIFWI